MLPSIKVGRFAIGPAVAPSAVGMLGCTARSRRARGHAPARAEEASARAKVVQKWLQRARELDVAQKTAGAELDTSPGGGEEAHEADEVESRDDRTAAWLSACPAPGSVSSDPDDGDVASPFASRDAELEGEAMLELLIAVGNADGEEDDVEVASIMANAAATTIPHSRRPLQQRLQRVIEALDPGPPEEDEEVGAARRGADALLPRAAVHRLATAPGGARLVLGRPTRPTQARGGSPRTRSQRSPAISLRHPGINSRDSHRESVRESVAERRGRWARRSGAAPAAARPARRPPTRP
jgi:hypothetical protein